MNDDRDDLIEQALAAWRPVDREGWTRGHPAWHDLDQAGRIEVHSQALRLRAMEAALDPQGLSTTGRAVLARIRAGGQGR